MFLQHPQFTRRDMLQAGAIGLMGLSMPDLLAMRAAAATLQYIPGRIGQDR